MLIKIFIDLFASFFDMILFLIPPLPVWTTLQNTVNSLGWLFNILAEGVYALGYIVGDNALVLLPLTINIVLIPIELSISLLWVFLKRFKAVGAD